MSDTLIEVIRLIPAVIALLTYRRVNQIHIQINSRMDQLIESVRGEATAIEHAAGLDRQQQEKEK